MTQSIRVRLLVWVIGGMAVLQVGFATVVYEVMERSLRDGFNAVLASSARTLSSAIEQDGQRIKVDIDEREFPEFRRARHPDYFQVWSESGEMLARSSSLKGADLQTAKSLREGTFFRRLRLPDGRGGRAAVLRFVPKADDESSRIATPARVTLVVARDTAALDSEMALLTWILSLGTIGTIAVSLVLAAVIVRQGLRPLDVVAADIAAIRQDDLSARVSAARLPSELRPVVQRLNDLLRRLEEAFGRERSFTADAAHELRTPLAGLRSTLEVALARPREGGEYRDALAECLAIVQQAQALTDQLLAVARMEGRQTLIAPEVVAVREVVDQAWRPHAETIRNRRLTLAIDVPPSAACVADRGLLLLALSALATNAAEYTDAGGRVEVTAVVANASVTVTFSNTGCRLRPENAAQVFKRFWRGDASRGQTGVHCGLGLTLAQQSVEAIGGSASASIDNGIFNVCFILPAAPPNRVVS